MNIIWIGIAVLAVSLSGALIFALWVLRSQHAAAVGELDSLRRDFNALCAGAVGVDKRVLRLEQRGRDLQQRQDSIEQQWKAPERPYGEAIQRVQKGAGVERLIEEFGLSQSEADLIVRLHGSNQPRHSDSTDVRKYSAYPSTSKSAG